ncbi:YALIA101S09e04786g1_1 [Yarrowia lipolytica]|nr:Tom5 [Yarrowia lipolytica]SEI36048.1 YALIA101S09e04786g1_1 [Yarrowia lipolytica]VBB87428.1 Component of the TOM (translocase of outer membrane) complex, putative [Yarrowia lipolytica]
MFGGQPQISDEDIRKYNLMTQRTLQNALYLAIGLWTAPFAFELIKGRF